MFTDIVGYTSLSQENEALALDLLQKHRDVIRRIIASHAGKEIKTIGDAFLIEFVNALDATDCAYDIQLALHDMELENTGKTGLKVRIGVHVGDVMHDENDVLGDAVNLASRIESIAEPGGIYLSGQVYDNVRNKVEFLFEYLGQESLKNVEVPLGIYKVVMPWDAVEKGRSSSDTQVTMPDVALQEEPKFETEFVDREIERKLLSSSLDEVMTTGKMRVVFIGGEAGIGKTRLVEWVCSDAVKRYKAQVARGYCLEEVSVPYFPFSECLGRFLNKRGKGLGSRQAVNWLDNALKRTFTQKEAEYERYQLFENVLRLLERISKERVFLVTLDDMHWSDTASLGLLHYIARNAKNFRMMILGTYRTEELGKTEKEGRHQLVQAIASMKKEGLISILELHGMEKDDMALLATSLIPGAPSKVLETVARESEGNPFYAIESTQLLVESGAIQHEAGVWRLKEPSELVRIPDAVLDIISRRLGRLAQDEREALECAALVGEHFEPRVIAHVLGADTLALTQRFAKLSRETKLIVEDGVGFRFDHAKVREALSTETPKPLRVELHKRIGAALLEDGSRYQASEIAYHFYEAGMKEQVVIYGLRAGEQALRQFANQEAVTCYTWVIDSVGTDERLLEIKALALLGRAEGLATLGQSDNSSSDAEEILRISREPKTRLSAMLRLGHSQFSTGHFSEALNWVNRAKSEPGDIPLVRLRLQNLEAGIVGYRGEIESAIEIKTQLADSFLKMGEMKDYADELVELSEYQVTSQNLKGAFDLIERASSVYKEINDVEGDLFCANSMGELYFCTGDVERGNYEYERANELAGKLGRFRTSAWIQLYWGLLCESSGQYEDALERTLDGMEACRLIDFSPYTETALLANQVRGFLRANRMADADAAYTRMNDIFEKHSKDASLTLRAAVFRSRGFYFGTYKSWKQADDAYLESINLIHRGPVGPIHEAETRREYAGLLSEQGRIEDASRELNAAIGLYEKLGNNLGITKSKEALLRLSPNSNLAGERNVH
jgi:class 3 adenylate cyclase/tetratricopeptide (TPR) repeat protein